MKTIIKKLAEARMRYAHASSIFSMFGMPFLVSTQLRELMFPKISLWVFIPTIVFGLLIVGIILDKIGLHKAEISYQAERNAPLMELQKK